MDIRVARESRHRCGPWPGLSRKRYQDEYADGIQIREGENWIAFPQVSAIIWRDINKEAEYIPVLLLWRDISPKSTFTWLILDERPEMSGKVFIMDSIGYAPLAGPMGALRDCEIIEDGWIGYQKEIWRIMVEREHYRGSRSSTL